MGWRNFSSKSLLVLSRRTHNALPPVLFQARESLKHATSVFDSRNLHSASQFPSPNEIKLPSLQHDTESSNLWRSVGVVVRNGVHMEKELDGLRLEFSRNVMISVVRILGCRGQSPFRFFKWILSSCSGFSLDSEFYDVIVNNLFLVQDYEGSMCILKDLSSREHSLTGAAFGFLRLRSFSNRRDSIIKVVEVLRGVGGSCFNSGIHSLISLLCELGWFDLAILVMELTPRRRRISYFNALMAAKCRSGEFRRAKELLDEMRRSICHPTTVSYNYLLGCLFKNGMVVEGCELLQMMEESGCLPNEVTYEVVIFRACRINNMDIALGFLNKMLEDGLKPRLTTHAALIKGYIRLGKIADAHEYVVDMSSRDSYSSNTNYSLLANLLRMCGSFHESAAILNEMMGKGLRPNFPVYRKLVKDLQKFGMKDIASNLTRKFMVFPSPTS